MDAEKILADIRSVARDLGKVPTAQDYREEGEHSLSPIYDSDRFDGFADAREQAGIDGQADKDIPHKIPREKLLQDIRGLWWHLGRVPSSGDYKEYGKYSMRPIYGQFDGWMDARKQAGVYDGHLQNLDKQDFIEQLQTLYDEIGEEPTIYDYYERFSEWDDPFWSLEGFTQLKKDAGVYEGKYGNEAREKSREDIIADLRQAADETDGPLSIADYMEHGEISFRTVTKEFDSFPAARAEAGLESSSLLFRTGSDHPNHTGNDKDIYKLARFRKNRPKVLERDNHECQHCGMDSETHIKRYGRDLHVHHIFPTSLVEYPDDSIHALTNMVTLCRQHHDVYERWYYGPDELLKLYGSN